MPCKKDIAVPNKESKYFSENVSSYTFTMLSWLIYIKSVFWLETALAWIVKIEAVKTWADD